MNTFVRAVVSGFAFTLGATLFRKVAKKIGLDEEPARNGARTATSAPGGAEPTSEPQVVH
jgi:hypothetical protein